MEANPRLMLAMFSIILVCSGCVDEDVDALASQKSTHECMPASDLKSYFNPLLGTLNLHYGVIPCEAVELVGEISEKAYVVLNDVGRYITKINGDGSTAWTYLPAAGSYVLDLKRNGNELQFIELEELVTMDPDSGAVTSRTPITYSICYDSDVQCAADGVIIHATQKKIPAYYPRDAVVSNGTAYVADTFNHRVIAYDIATDQILWTVESLYPNSIQVLSDRLIVTEEHANRVVAIDLASHAKTIVAGCDLDIYADPNASVSDIVTREATGLLSRPDGRSICEGIIYSLNFAAYQDDGTLLIADTDNHRILHLDANGGVLRELRNFNNPIRVLTLP